VRSLRGVLESERVELPLLARTRPLDRLDRAPLERAVHPLVRAILLRRTWGELQKLASLASYLTRSQLSWGVRWQ
jgi:hypothetical protein